MKNIKKIVLCGLLMGMNMVVYAQAKLNLSLLPDQKTYMVSMLPEHTWASPMNMVGSVQIVLRMPTGKPFLAGNIQSLINGVTWIDNSYIDHPASDAAHNFACIVLNEKGTKLIPFVSGVETPLFTFVNLEQECVGLLELVENTDPAVQAVVSNDHINVTQNITVLGARGNVVTGLVNGAVDCTPVVTGTDETPVIKNLEVFPVPATEVLHINWENANENEKGQLRISNLLGEQIAILDISKSAGPQSVQLDVKTYSTGVYNASFLQENGEGKSFRFVVIR